jgi:hypothetical protein
MGNKITTVLETGRGVYAIRIARSLRVVKSRISGGWIMGTKLI